MPAKFNLIKLTEQNFVSLQIATTVAHRNKLRYLKPLVPFQNLRRTETQFVGNYLHHIRCVPNAFADHKVNKSVMEIVYKNPTSNTVNGAVYIRRNFFSLKAQTTVTA